MTSSFRIALAAILFFALEALLMRFVDRPLSEYLHTIDLMHHGIIDFFRTYTDLGLGKWYEWPSGIGAILCALALRKKSLSDRARRHFAAIGKRLVFLFACVALSGITTDIIKWIVGRGRPVLLDRENFYGFAPFSHGNNWHSWPSGHATTAFAFAAVMIVLLPRLRSVWVAYALALALSRIMVNAHYLSDVIAGAAIGLLTIVLLRRLINHNGIIHINYCIFPIDSSGAAG